MRDEFVIPANRDNADFIRTIPAGEEREIIVVGDFIYCKEASQDVDVIVNGKTTRMQAGDVRKLGSPYRGFYVRNNDQENPVQVVFVAGFGNFDRKIVEGVIGSEAVTRGAGGVVRPDTRQRLSFEVVPSNLFEQEFTAGDLIRQSSDTFPLYAGQTGNIKFAGDADGDFWVFVRDTKDTRAVYKLNESLEVVDQRSAPEIGLENINIAVNGTFYAGSQSNGLYYLNGVYGGNDTIGPLPSNIPGMSNDADYYGGLFDPVKGVFVGLAFDGVGLPAFWVEFDFQANLLKSEAVNVPSGTLNNAARIAYDAIYGRYILALNSGEIFAVTTDYSEYELIADNTNDDRSSGLAVKGDRIFAPDDIGSVAVVNERAVVDTEQKISFETVAPCCGVPAAITKKPRKFTTASFDTFKGVDGVTVSGEFIRLALEAYYGRSVIGEYMDSVYALDVPGAFYVSGGNKSLAADGQDDSVTVKTPARVTLTIDANLKLGGNL